MCCDCNHESELSSDASRLCCLFHLLQDRWNNQMLLKTSNKVTNLHWMCRICWPTGETTTNTPTLCIPHNEVTSARPIMHSLLGTWMSHWGVNPVCQPGTHCFGSCRTEVLTTKVLGRITGWAMQTACQLFWSLQCLSPRGLGSSGIPRQEWFSPSPGTRERNIICNAPMYEEGIAKQHVNFKTGLNVCDFPSFCIKTIHWSL